MDFKTLDDVATWMLSNIRLSRYDDQFVNNLTLYITQHGRITSNQHALFKRVATKYVRQFNHHKVNVNEIVQMNWSVPIEQSIPEYTSASIKIEDSIIVFKSPYNKNFLTALRKNPIPSMLWHRDTRQHTIDYNATNLRDLIYITSEHYQSISYCPITTDIIDKMAEYESVKYWVPTLTYVNGFYCIKAINTHLQNAIEYIPFNDDLSSIALLAKHGVKIDNSVIEHLSEIHDPAKVKFAATFHVEHELKEISTAIKWLKELGCDGITRARSFMQNLCATNGISLDIPVNDYSNNAAMIYYKGNLSTLEDSPVRLLKIIKCVNSEPIDLGPK